MPATWRRQGRGIDALDSQVVEEPERAEQIYQRVRAAELMQVQPRLVGVVELGLDSREEIQRAQRTLPRAVGNLCFVQRRAQHKERDRPAQLVRCSCCQ